MLPVVDQKRHDLGIKKLRAMGKTVEKAVREDLASVSPDMARYAVEHACGEIYSRPGLNPKNREMIAIAALTVLGYTLPQLKQHIEAALNQGVTKSEIEEIIIQMSVYAGYPISLNAMGAAKEVFEEFEETNTEL